jgi:glycosyltransferase involved in cell wall biosynthesis
MTGVEHTSAQYVMPLDADDALTPGALSVLADALDADADAVMAWGNIHVFGEIDTQLAAGHQLDPWQIAYLNTLPVASMVRRTSLLSAGGWQLRHGYEDWDLWMAFAERGWPGAYVPTTVLRYRRRGSRMLEGCIPRHGELYAELRRRHPRLFHARRRNWLGSRAPLATRMLYPAISLLPLSDLDKSRLFQFANAPRQFLAVRRLRRAARLESAPGR